MYMWQWVIQYLFPGIYVHIPKAQHSVFPIIGTNEIHLVEGMSRNPIPLIDKQIDFLLSHFPSWLPTSLSEFLSSCFLHRCPICSQYVWFPTATSPPVPLAFSCLLGLYSTIITSWPGKMSPQNYMVQTCKWFWPKVLLYIAWLPWFYLESSPQPHHQIQQDIYTHWLVSKQHSWNTTSCMMTFPNIAYEKTTVMKCPPR